jgi:Cyclin, C-terminal domain.
MLLSYQILEFDYSLIASAALFMACKLSNYTIDSDLLSNYKGYLDVHTLKDFEKCVNTIKNIWETIRTTTTYANFEAVYNKYQVQHSFFGTTLIPPLYTKDDLQNWFYGKH